MAHLITIYDQMAPEASALIWEAFRYVVEDEMDKEKGRWKEGVSYRIGAWAESLQCEEENEELTEDSNDFK